MFGTDGVRGLANSQLDPVMVLNIGRAVGYLLRAESNGDLIIGKDTRWSGDMLEAALIAGLTSAGCQVLLAGVVTTPAVAFASSRRPIAGGIMLSASHNTFEYNGVKIFGPDGFKIDDEVEDAIECLVRDGCRSLPVPTGHQIGRCRSVPTVIEEYEDYLVQTGATSLAGLKVMLDCAHGSASGIAQRVFSRLGAQTKEINAFPDGLNINVASGSTHPATLAQAVLQGDAAIGFAFDGDADRLIAVDEHGQLVDGDAILAICGLEMARTGQLVTRRIVATVMSNLGLEIALQASGIELVRTGVGDRYVLENMRRHGHCLGGEQSGHIIFLEHATTGDGILTAVQLAGIVARTGRPLSELAAVVEKVPQVLLNVKINDREGITGNQRVEQAMAAAKSRLGSRGRLLVRPSGTEPLVRVMVEALDQDEAEAVASELVDVIRQELERT